MCVLCLSSAFSEQGNVTTFEQWWRQIDACGYFIGAKQAPVHELRLVAHCKAAMYQDVLNIRDQMNTLGLPVSAFGE